MPFETKLDVHVVGRREKKEKIPRIFDRFKASTIEKLKTSLVHAKGRYVDGITPTPEKPWKIKVGDVEKVYTGAYKSPCWTLDNPKDDAVIAGDRTAEKLLVRFKAGNASVPIFAGRKEVVRTDSDKLVQLLEELIVFAEGLTLNDEDGIIFHDIAKAQAQPRAGEAYKQYVYDEYEDEWVDPNAKD